MEDSKRLPSCRLEEVALALEQKPLDQRTVKEKLERIYQITPHTELDILPDVLEALAWLKLLVTRDDFARLTASEAVYKYMLEEFPSTLVRFLIINRVFKEIEPMIATQQVMVESFRFITARYDLIEKHPKMLSVLKTALDTQKPFWRLNYIANSDYSHLYKSPSPAEVKESEKFLLSLQSGDAVDVLKGDYYSHNASWFPGTVSRIQPHSLHIAIKQGTTKIFQRSKVLMQILPLGSKKECYEWRYNLVPGDFVDYKERDSRWVVAKVTGIQRDQEGGSTPTTIEMEYTTEQGMPMTIGVQITSSTIQRRGLIVPEGRLFAQMLADDFQDFILDPLIVCKFRFHQDICKSELLIDCYKSIDEMGLFARFKKDILEGRFGVEVTTQILSFLHKAQFYFHRAFASQYFKEIVPWLIGYVKNSPEQIIRNFTKERFQTFRTLLLLFLKRFNSRDEYPAITKEFYTSTVNRFLFSDFLDRKLYAVSLLNSMVKTENLSMIFGRVQDFLDWIHTQGVLAAIYHEKSHSELISRSAEFLQEYLKMGPEENQLVSLLELSEPILKLVADNFESFPRGFQDALIAKIKEKKNVVSKDALKIVMSSEDCSDWLLQNGGECWVENVMYKTNRKQEIMKVFTQPFPVILKITLEISEKLQAKIKSQFFKLIEQQNVLTTVFADQTISLDHKIEFANIVLEHLGRVSQQLYAAVLPFTTRVLDSNPLKYNNFFNFFVGQLDITQLQELFQSNFTQPEKLQSLGLGQMALFATVFMALNKQKGKIDVKQAKVYNQFTFKYELKEQLTIRISPKQLFGMNELMAIIFENKHLDVTESAFQLVGSLFDILSKDLTNISAEFTSNLLERCLSKFYMEPLHAQKYLSIVGKLMNESEKAGTDCAPSVNALFPSKDVTFVCMDHYNTTKQKVLVTVRSNCTLYELRAAIGRKINAYVHEMKIMAKNKELDSNLNGQVLHTLDLLGQLLTIEKKSSIPKVALTNSAGALTPRAKQVLLSIFQQYSTEGLMNKAQYQRYLQKTSGDYYGFLESKVTRTYQQFDTDNDGNLNSENFLQACQSTAYSKDSSLWLVFESFGIRNDLMVLTKEPTQYPNPEGLTKNLIASNPEFIQALSNSLLDQKHIGEAAWRVASRLSLLTQIESKLDGSTSPYAFRYWLLIIDQLQKYEAITPSVLEQVAESDCFTMCIGLRIASKSKCLTDSLFQKILTIQKKICLADTVSFYESMLLKTSLEVFQCGLEKFYDHYEASLDDQAFTIGLMNPKTEVRSLYASFVSEVAEATVQKDFRVFQKLFMVVYTNFQNCDKSTLSIEYFDLFSSLLELLHGDSELLQKLALNWVMVTENMTRLYTQHTCTERSLNSKPDEVAQGFLRIISKLLFPETLGVVQPLVGYIFKKSLFPDSGSNKLKNSQTRKDGYDLVAKICSMPCDTTGSALQLLFDSDFQKIYKKMTQSQNTTSYSSHSLMSSYYNYYEGRSSLGYAGIKNLGCICYMLSVLQQLYMTVGFRNMVLMASDGLAENPVERGGKKIDDNLFHQFQDMFANLLLTEKQEFNPQIFCFSFKDSSNNPINISVQQDAQEFINIFIDKLENMLEKTPFKRIFQGFFGGRTCNRTVCSNCNAVNDRHEPFYTLSLEIKGYSSIQASLAKYIAGEVISDYQCDACKRKTDVTKSSYLSHAPNYFIVHLQRMAFNYEKFENQKVNSRWEFPLDLNVYDYSVDAVSGIADDHEKYTYALKGVVLHYGSAEFGHYFSYIKESDNLWLEFNDEKVREFHLADLKSDCFGGDSWRRESQNAYLLVYEKVKKHNIVLQFDSNAAKSSFVNLYSLEAAVVAPPQQVEVEDPELEKDVEKEDSQKQGDQAAQTEGTKTVEEPKKPKVQLMLNPIKIPQWVAAPLEAKINDKNEEFTFTMNVNHDDFAYFIQKILEIDPPEHLQLSYLDLCLECFSLKQTLESEDETITLSEWATQRFKKLVKGKGWEFLKKSSKAVLGGLFSHEKSTRIAMRNLLECLVMDTVNERGLVFSKPSEQDAQIYSELVKLLMEFTDMMLDNKVYSYRCREYYLVWVTLIKELQFVRDFASKVALGQYLLDQVLEKDSPFNKRKKRKTSDYYYNDYENQLLLLSILLENGYKLNELEAKCMRPYSFLQKILKHPSPELNLVETICFNNRAMSEKIAFYALDQLAKVSHSEYVKPIIEFVHKFLSIKDNLYTERKEWLIGYPMYIESGRNSSFGIHNIDPEFDKVINYLSPIRGQPLLAYANIQRQNKHSPHILALLLTMLLRLEADGHISNLEEYPSILAFEGSCTTWVDKFVKSYEQEENVFYKVYLEYAQQLKAALNAHLARQSPTPVRYLIGKNIERKVLSEEKQANQLVKVVQLDVISAVLPMTGDALLLNRFNINKYPGSEMFKIKVYPNVYPLSGEMPSIDEAAKPFAGVQEVPYIRKITLTNTSSEDLLLVYKIEAPQGLQPNAYLTKSEWSCEIAAGESFSHTLYRKNVAAQIPVLQVTVKAMGMATTHGYLPRMIITPVEEDKADDVEDSEEEDFQC